MRLSARHRSSTRLARKRSHPSTANRQRGPVVVVVVAAAAAGTTESSCSPDASGFDAPIAEHFDGQMVHKFFIDGFAKHEGTRNYGSSQHSERELQI